MDRVGSIWGPLLFNIYINKPVTMLMTQHYTMQAVEHDSLLAIVWFENMELNEENCHLFVQGY